MEYGIYTCSEKEHLLHLVAMRRAVGQLLLVVGAASLKVTVLGGSGFVGSRVCKSLVAAGAQVKSVSKSGAAPSWCAGEEWVKSVDWCANELTRGSREKLCEAIGSPDTVVSTVGSVGFEYSSNGLNPD